MEEEIQIEVAAPQAAQQFQLDSRHLEQYYNLFFPFSQMYKWLAYEHDSDSSYFSRREFSLTLPGDIYIRYQMVNNEKEFKDLLCSKLPEKMDIGAVFDKQGKKGDGLIAKEKEFVIDIDMTDYDTIRTCCSGAKICSKCWKFMRLACKLLSQSLEDDFGFNNILWVFSGRRGIHAWVCDQEMRKANDSTRSSIIDYLNIVNDNTQSASYVKTSLLNMKTNYIIDRSSLKPLTTSATEEGKKRLESKSERDFREIILKDQNLFVLKPELILGFLDKGRREKSGLKEEIEKLWKGVNTSEERYEILKQEIAIRKNDKNSQKYHNILEELKIWLLYPRLDVNVSKSTNHLLKSPFCVHPKTGNLCVPFTSQEIDTFDPFSVPQIQTLSSEEGKRKMAEYLAIFTKFLDKLAAGTKKN